MNNFLLNWDIETCAQWHCDKHVVKMPLESTQMLCTVHWQNDSPAPYKLVHPKHPCTIWAGQTVENYSFLWNLAIALCKEYTFRYDKKHACEKVLAFLKCPPKNITSRGFTKFAQAMPDEYKCNDPIIAYRSYYINEKIGIATWKKRQPPPFMNQKIEAEKLSHSQKKKLKEL